MPGGARRRGTVLVARAPSAGAVRRRRRAAGGRGGRGINHLGHARAHEPALVQRLAQLDRVRRGALAQVVRHDPQVERLVVAGVAADAPDVDVVVAVGVDRERVARVVGVVDHGDARRGAQDLARLFGRQGRARLDVDRLRVAVDDRHAHARRADADRRVAEDLARLVDELALLVGVVVARREVARMRQRVERDAVRVGVRRGRLVAGEQRPRLVQQLVDRLLARAGHRLVGRDHEALDPGRVVQRLERDDHLHGRAVGVRDDPAVAVERFRVDLGDDERHVVGHAPLRGVVDDDGPGLDEARRPLARRRAAGREDREVEALDRLVGERLHDEPAVEPAPGRALGRERDDLARGERPLAQQAQHDAADLPGRADDGDAVAVARRHAATSPNGCSGRIVPSPESSNAVWSALTASGTRSPGTTQEMRIGEVEIISMLMPLSPSVVNTFAATPGWVFIPAPTIETLPIDSSVATCMPSSVAMGSSAVCAAWMSSRGIVNDMSARRPSVSGSPWTIMSMFTLASASAVVTRPATPGVSGPAMSVTRASPSECVTAVMRGCSTVSSSERTTVPGASSKLDRQWMRTPWLRAYSTERSCSTPAPDAAISSISSNDTTRSLRALGTRRGSALKTPGTSV